MDLYLPSRRNRETRFPVVLQIHGGGWYRGDKATPRERNIALNLAMAGFACASVNYVLADHAPRFPDRIKQVWPRNLHDCMTAVRFLRANAEKYKIDPNRIAALGTSAGGQIAALLGVLDRGSALDCPTGQYRDFPWRVQAVVSMYGVHNFRLLSKCRGLDLSKEEVELCDEASPVTHVQQNSSPLLILHGTDDQIVSCNQSRSLSEVASTNGVKNELHLINGAEHRFHLEPPQEDLRPRVISFLNGHL